jgi:hypothetical protein
MSLSFTALARVRSVVLPEPERELRTASTSAAREQVVLAIDRKQRSVSCLATRKLRVI